MTLKEIREDYFTYSTNVSNLFRNLSYAGIGIIWLFKYTSSTGSIALPGDLIIPLLLFVLTLILDISQYFIQSVVWYNFYKEKRKELGEHEKEEDKVVKEPEKWNRLPWILWALKFGIVFSAYIILGYYVLSILIQ